MQCRSSLSRPRLSTISVDRVSLCGARAWSLKLMRSLFRGTEWPHLRFWRFRVSHIVWMIGVAAQTASRSLALGGGEGPPLRGTTPPWWWCRIVSRAIVGGAESTLVEILCKSQSAERLNFSRWWTWASTILVRTQREMRWVENEASAFWIGMRTYGINFKNLINSIIICGKSSVPVVEAGVWFRTISLHLSRMVRYTVQRSTGHIYVV